MIGVVGTAVVVPTASADDTSLSVIIKSKLIRSGSILRAGGGESTNSSLPALNIDVVDGVHVTLVDTPDNISPSLHAKGTLRNDSNQSKEDEEEFIINDNSQDTNHDIQLRNKFSSSQTIVTHTNQKVLCRETHLVLF
jgi:hypothetical protein